jgi:hypothetical protein
MNLISISLISVLVMTFLWFVVQQITKKARYSNRSGMFRFNDGLNTRSIDPIEVLSLLNAHPEFRLDTHPKQARNGNAYGIRICIDAIQSAFGVQKYSTPKQPGLTTVEMLALLDAFQVYCLRQKKNIEVSQISEPSTESTSTNSRNEIETPTLASG